MLAKATGAIVNVDSLEAHGTNDRTKTDVLLHFVDSRSDTFSKIGSETRSFQLSVCSELHLRSRAKGPFKNYVCTKGGRGGQLGAN